MNYLTPILVDYFKEITKLEGGLLTIKSFINYTQNHLDLEPDANFVELISTYRDLSQLDGGNNLYWTGQHFSYKIKEDTLFIESRECCFGIAQTYEIFESFLKRIVVELLENNYNYISLVTNDTNSNIISKESLIEIVNQFQKKDKNNKKFLWLFRKISTFYKKHEKENICRYNMADWFDLVSEIRHAIIHNRQNLTDKVKISIKRNDNQAIFGRYFNEDLSILSGFLIIDILKTGEIIHLFNQFAHLIWKSLSLECNLNADYQ